MDQVYIDQQRAKGLAQVRQIAIDARTALGLPDADMRLLAKMRQDPPGTVRTLDERRAFERRWNYLVSLRS